ncbi:MAG: CNNM domain-containing protein [Verrucomicrobiales bacterium]
MDLLLLLILPFSVAVSFICSGMEAGLFVLSRWRIGQQAKEGNARAILLNRFLQNPENFLWTIVAGNTLSAISAASILVVFLLGNLATRPVLLVAAFLAAVFVFYVLCDLLPKVLFRKFPNRLCSRMAAPFRLLHIGLSPLVSLIEGFSGWLLKYTGGKMYTGHVFSSRDEFRSVFQDTGTGLSNEERSMINRVLDLQNIPVRQLNIPFSKFPTVLSETPLGELIEIFKDAQLNSIPVWSNHNKQRVAGTVNVKSFMFQETKSDAVTSDFIAPALFVDENIRLDEALRRMQRTGNRLAIIVGRNRTEIGAITLESILQVIFGEVNL